MNWRQISVLPLLALSFPAAAQAIPETVDLQTVLTLARTSSPRVGAEEQDIAGAQAERQTANALPNPSISYSGSYQPGGITNFEGRRAHETTVEMPLDLGGKRRARVAAADRRIDAARSRLAVSKLDFMSDTGSAFLALLGAQEMVGVRRDAMAELDRLRGIVAGRRASGMASDYDVARVDVEIESARADLVEAESDVISARTDLANALGFAGWHPVATGTLDEVSGTGFSPAQSADVLPAVVAAQDEQNAARADVLTARRERFPEVSINGGRFWTTSPFGATYMAGLTLEVPLFDRRNGAVRKAEADARAAELRTEIARAKALAEIDRYTELVETRATALDTFNSRVGGKLDALGRMAEDSYRLGGGSVIELIDATRSRFDNVATRIGLAGKLAEARLHLRLAREDGAGD
ncbi:MAG: TolC family protein [Novosphingobium sp.]